MKLTNIIVSLQFAFSSLSFVTLHLNNKIENVIENKVLSQEDSDNKFDQWINSIKSSSLNNNIQLFITRDVSLIYQQALIATNYMLINNKINGNQNVNKYYWLVNEKDYDTNKWNFNYYRDNYNNLKIITNTYDLNHAINHPYDNWLDSTMIFELINYFKMIFNGTFKIDLWISDINIEELWNGSNDNSNSLAFYEMLKYTDKINVISDGNYQTKYFALNFVDRINSLKNQLSKIDANKKINDYKNDINNSLYNEFKSTSIYDFLLDNSYINIFNIASYYNSPYYKLISGYNFYQVYEYQYDYYSMANLLFDKNNEAEYFNDFVSLYERFFNWSNINSFEDLILENKDLYDRNKKNVIYIGDSLITDESEFYPQRKEELNKITEAMLKKYNPKEYNWIFKNHPRYTLEVQKYLNSFMFNNNFKPIYLKNFPWEMFLSWDNKKQKEDSNYQPFFGNSVNLSENTKTILTGLQYSSTVIETTWFFLKNVYNLDDFSAYNSINANNFPIAATFDIIRPTKIYNFNPNQNYLKNYQGIVDIHEPFYQLHNFYDYKNDLMDSKTYINNQGIDYSYPTKSNPTILFAIVGTIVFIGIIIIVVVIFIKIYVNKKKKNTKG